LSGGISLGGFFGLNTFVVTTAGLRVTSTCANAGEAATENTIVSRNQRAARKEHFMRAMLCGNGNFAIDQISPPTAGAAMPDDQEEN
jgi:hypothetical protein